MPLVFIFVLGLAFLLMLFTFRSIVIPIKAIVLNLLSVGAAYGVLVIVFQNGAGESLLGFESNGGVTNWLPVFLFVILFGLSMDYHVFILSRVRELYDRGMSTDDAVREGISRTAGTVTSAAIVMVARVRRVRHALIHRLQADGRGPGVRDPDRRDHHPGRPAPRDDEAARRLELVPPRMAGPAACRAPAAGAASSTTGPSHGPSRSASRSAPRHGPVAARARRPSPGAALFAWPGHPIDRCLRRSRQPVISAPMSTADEMAKQAADRVREVVAEAERRAEEIVAQAESDADGIRQRAEADAKERIERAQAALRELAGETPAPPSPTPDPIPGPPSPDPEPPAPTPDPGPPGRRRQAPRSARPSPPPTRPATSTAQPRCPRPRATATTPRRA